eukprot:7192173-Pyramimonas_sp.AAC.1
MAALVGNHELTQRYPDPARRAVALASTQGRPGVEDLATGAPTVAWKLAVELSMGDIQGLEELRGHLAHGVLRVAERVHYEPVPNRPCGSPWRLCP